MRNYLACGLVLSLAGGVWGSVFAAEGPRWKIHDMSRPRPRVVTPPAQMHPAPPPSDAVVLFDGRDLSEWVGAGGGPAKWPVRDGILTVGPGAGLIATKRAFGDVQVHLEWASPLPATGKGQDRGNSGIHLMGKYEIQILDSYQNDTYADGQAGSVYGQYPPLVNACRPPGEWQSYDIVFRRPRFDAQGKVLRPARVSVLHNGILVQDNVELLGPTSWLHYLPYEKHADRLPFTLQDHGHPVRYRNIWVRELPEDERSPVVGTTASEVKLGRKELKRYVGEYVAGFGSLQAPVHVVLKGGRLLMEVPIRKQVFDLVPLSTGEFTTRATDARVKFDLDANGTPNRFSFMVGQDVGFAGKRR